MMKDYKTPTLVVHTLKIKTLMAASYDKEVFNGSVDTSTSDIMDSGEEAGAKSCYFYDGF